MIDGIPINGTDLTVGGLYILLVLLFFFERVVPIGRVRAAQEDTKYWREVSEKKDLTISQLTETNRLLAGGVGETVAKVMTELQIKAGDDE